MRFIFSASLTMLLCGVMPACAADAPATQPKQVIPLDAVEGRIDHMAVDEKGGRLFVAALGNNTVEVIDLAAGKKIDTIKGLDEPQGIVFIPDSGCLVVASGGDSKCRIYDGSLKMLSQIGDLADADNVRYDAKAKQAIVGFGSGALAFIDPQTGTKVRELKLDGHPESFQLEKNGNRIFVNVPGAGHVAIVDRDKGQVVAKWTLADAKSNFPMALDEANHRLFVGCRSPAKLLVLNTETGKTVASVDIVGDTDDVFYDAAGKQLFVSGGAGHVSVIAQKDADTYTVAGQVDTASGARTSLFVPGLGMLYVAVPHRGTQLAELSVFKMTNVATH